MPRPKQLSQTQFTQGALACSGLIAFIVILTGLHNIEVDAQQNWGDWKPPEWNPWIPPWNNFEPYVIVRTYYGDVKGIKQCFLHV